MIFWNITAAYSATYSAMLKKKIAYWGLVRRRLRKMKRREKLRPIQVKFFEFFSKFFIRKNAEERIVVALTYIFMQKFYALHKLALFNVSGEKKLSRPKNLWSEINALKNDILNTFSSFSLLFWIVYLFPRFLYLHFT